MKDKHVGVKMPWQVFKALQKIANAKGISLSALVRHILIQQVKYEANANPR